MWGYYRFQDCDRAQGWHTFVGFDSDITWAACGRFGQYGNGKGDIDWWQGENPPPEQEQCQDCRKAKEKGAA